MTLARLGWRAAARWLAAGLLAVAQLETSTADDRVRGELVAQGVARMAEAERLDRREHRFSEALVIYRELVERHPEARFAARARARSEYLTWALAAGEEPLRIYEDTLARYREIDRDEAFRNMNDLVARHPEFPLRGRAMRWLARESENAGRVEEAESRYRTTIAEQAGSDDERFARAALGGLLVRRGRYSEALALFDQLEALPEERWQRVGADLRRSTQELVVRRALALALGAGVLAVLGLGLAGVPWANVRWGEILDPRRDLAMIAAPATLLLLVARGAPPPIFRSILTTLAALPILLAFNRLLLEGACTQTRRVVHVVLVVPLVLAVHYCVLWANGLGEMLEHTFRFGPEI